MSRFAFLLFAAASAQAEPPRWNMAPLPPFFETERVDEIEAEDDADQPWQPPRLRGLYAHGFLGDFTELGSVPENFCVGTEQDRAALTARIPNGSTTEFWFYSTGKQAILFKRVAYVDGNKPCSSALTFSGEIDRAFVVDGMIHSFEVDDGELSVPETYSDSYSSGVYSGSFSTLHNLLVRLPIVEKGRRSQEKIAKLRATCVGTAGIAWNNLCRSRVPGPTYGMLLSAQAGDDTQVHFNFEVDEVRTNVWLDGRLWETGRDWTFKE